MKLHFRLTSDLTVEIEEEVGKDAKQPELIKTFMKRFLANKEAVLRFFRMWLINELRAGDLGEKISELFPLEQDTDILRPVVEACPVRVRRHFLPAPRKEEGRDNTKNNSNWERLFEQFHFFDVDDAKLEMVWKLKEKEAEENG